MNGRAWRWSGDFAPAQATACRLGARLGLLASIALACQAPVMAADAVAVSSALPEPAQATTLPGSVASAARDIAFDADRGNCLACHALAGGTPAGNVGPALEGVAGRFASPAALYAFLWDARASRPEAMMPRYGRNGLLSARELALLTEWLWTL